ncbi:MAG TPA: c-type cytochrome [Candidatus Sulfotelmatobacter sp.]|jgi:cytochrome c553|nr:c-type cytochrome [Candidatus Sulfotelmatobacter sp.]
MLKHLTRTAVALGALALGLVSAHAEDAPDGKQLFMKSTCVACHGKDGQKAIQMYPNLAGQDKAYLLAQMKDITDGKRVSGPDARGYPRTMAMKDVMVVVTPDQMKTIADWLSTVAPAPIQPAAADAKVADGAALYAKAGCPSCHGKDGIKPMAGYPVIGGQKREYLLLQIKEIRDGVRTNGRTKMMVPMVKALNDDQVGQLADYLSQVDRAAAK